MTTQELNDGKIKITTAWPALVKPTDDDERHLSLDLTNEDGE